MILVIYLSHFPQIVLLFTAEHLFLSIDAKNAPPKPQIDVHLHYVRLVWSLYSHDIVQKYDIPLMFTAIDR
jgi:hypothetical protein